MKAYLVDAGEYRVPVFSVAGQSVYEYPRAIGVVFANSHQEAWKVFFNDTENEYWKYLEYTDRKSIRRLGKKEYDIPKPRMLVEADWNLDEDGLPSGGSLGEELWDIAYTLIGKHEEDCSYCSGTGGSYADICEQCDGIGKIEVYNDGLLK